MSSKIKLVFFQGFSEKVRKVTRERKF